jgi:hypothetical protein
MSENPVFRLFRDKEREQHKQFASLREEVHLQVGIQLLERKRNNPQLTPEEAALGIYLEQLEPQVRDAVIEFNRKGYRTGYSGFSGGKSGGKYDVEYQEISGGFFIDDKTRQKLATMEVEVTTEPLWTWEMDKKLGKADPNTPPEGRITTRVRFQAKHPDLREIENKWKEIAGLLPDKRQP